jgi:SNF2 family DNA or RNA helicase
LRLKQICGTTVTFTGKDDSSKLDVAVEDACEIVGNNHRLVVFTQFRDVLEAFCTRLDAAMPDTPIWELHGDIPQHDRQPYVRQWSTHPKAGVIVCMLQVAGVGLNMTAARHAQFLDKLWTPGMNQQAIDRLHRIGASETQPVQILEYHMKGTVETRVEQILRTKSKLFGTIVNDADFKKKLIEALRSRANAA